jgi:hypothetical protein
MTATPRDTSSAAYAARPGFDAGIAGLRAECDGGRPLAGGLAGREEFTGTLTGEYVDHSDPPWRWYRMTALTRKPAGYAWDEVWCEKDSVFILDEVR